MDLLIIVQVRLMVRKYFVNYVTFYLGLLAIYLTYLSENTLRKNQT